LKSRRHKEAEVSVEDEVTTYLQQAGLGTPGTDMFEIRSPDQPDDVVVIRSYPGIPGLKVQEKPGLAYESPAIQITVRSMAADKAMNKARQVYSALMIVRNQFLSGIWYLHITPSSPPYLIGFDQVGRTEFGFNAQIQKAPS
jgi:hypothetical protein